MFLEVLRTTFGTNAILTAAVGLTPFAGPDGNPFANVASYAKYLSYINLMTVSFKLKQSRMKMLTLGPIPSV